MQEVYVKSLDGGNVHVSPSNLCGDWCVCSPLGWALAKLLKRIEEGEYAGIVWGTGGGGGLVFEL